jgi:YHS domain-containing protein
VAFAFTNSKGKTYYLHARQRPLKNGGMQTLYFFASEKKDGALDAMPKGYMVSETSAGLPVLKRRQ